MHIFPHGYRIFPHLVSQNYSRRFVYRVEEPVLPLHDLYIPQRKVVTMIRRPYSRLLSEYSFVHSPCSIISFWSFASHSYRHNWQLAVLTGKRDISQVRLKYNNSTQNDLIAVRNLVINKQLVIGIFENYQQSRTYIFSQI